MSHADDLHALAVRETLELRHGLRVAIVESDRVAASSPLTWDSRSGEARVTDASGQELALRDLGVVWWRRLSRQAAPAPGDVAAELAENDSRAGLLGVFLAGYDGPYVSDPWSTAAADNKVVQLRAGAAAGLRIPRTLVSSDPVRVEEFVASLPRAVVKPVKGTLKAPLFTQFVSAEALERGAVRAAPAIYQEYVAGTRHLRVHLFGDEECSVLIDSDDLDWRRDLTVPMTPYRLDQSTRSSLTKLLDLLGLRMGVVDLKLLPDGDVVFLEVNPQGQFLFVEALCRLPLVDQLADLLVHDMVAA